MEKLAGASYGDVPKWLKGLVSKTTAPFGTLLHENH